VWTDQTPDSRIQTVLFYPVVEETPNVLGFPILYLKKTGYLQLDFDEMADTYNAFNFKLIHCNADWRQSILNDFEFLETFNEFTVDDYEISLNTRTPYVHYNIKVPPVKITGNYILKVYRNMNPSEVVLTRRFVVYDNGVGVKLDPKFPLDPALRNSGQQIDFDVSYGAYPIFNPREMVKVVLRQNGRWDNAKTDLVPQFIRSDQNRLEYHFFNNENVFPGLNEYRGFDIRSIRFRGQNMANTRFDNDGAQAWVLPDKSRNIRTMGAWIDANGRYVIENFETRRGHVEADYVDTWFTLDLDSDPDGDIYLFGQMTDWEVRPANKMERVGDKFQWKGHIRLKQGFYNYSYVVVKPGQRPNEATLEGSYVQTENVYDVLVYFRPVGGRYDQVIGYAQVNYNKIR
jgi:hypothetical protein